MIIQEHVLISQGYCTARGLSVPSPYYLQELLCNFWPDMLETEKQVPFIFSNIIPSVQLDPRDSFFIKDISGDLGCWWHGGDSASFDQLNELFWNWMKKASPPIHRIKLLNQSIDIFPAASRYGDYPSGRKDLIRIGQGVA